ncbi:MAG: 3-hydroxyacyl-CoA dehydrogenase family protein [Parachlamydiaceae bacterium]|nr:3-hydroxyacyl-CoA dehydrogenase family protein [Parachlamydiaceae bacterium]
MNVDEALKRVAVLGAAGKMGSGIATLLLQEMARSEASTLGQVGSGEYRLVLIDSNEKALIQLRRQLRSHLTKYSEKNINALRQYYANNPKLVSNEEMIDAFVEGALDCVRMDIDPYHAVGAHLVFEAIAEDLQAKTQIFSALNKMKKGTQYYLSNTSSIPISVLNEQSYLKNTLVGFHFYNPPAVQKILEIVIPENTDPELALLVPELGKRLNKVMVTADDVAGFIGNGYFIRELTEACQMAKKLASERSWELPKAVYAIDRVMKTYLLRPMGVFQLMDYIGIDICCNIAKTMQQYIPNETFGDVWMQTLVEQGVRGGQHPDGTQKPGCFQYEHHHVSGVYDIELKKYLSVTSFTEEVDAALGIHSKVLTHSQARQEKQEALYAYLQKIWLGDTLGVRLAKQFTTHTQNIAQHLVVTRVVKNLEDLDTVLKDGFFHLYGTQEIPKINAEFAMRGKR